MYDFYINIFLTFLLGLLTRDAVWLVGKWIIKSTTKNIAGDAEWRKKVGAPIFDENGKIVIDKQEKLSVGKAVRKSRSKKVTRNRKKVLHTPKKSIELVLETDHEISQVSQM